MLSTGFYLTVTSILVFEYNSYILLDQDLLEILESCAQEEATAVLWIAIDCWTWAVFNSVVSCGSVRSLETGHGFTKGKSYFLKISFLTLPIDILVKDTYM